MKKSINVILRPPISFETEIFVPDSEDDEYEDKLEEAVHEAVDNVVKNFQSEYGYPELDGMTVVLVLDEDGNDIHKDAIFM